MSELCLSGSTKSPHFSNLILSDLKLFFLFISSHPLYFCYIIFFSPYIFKLFSFLSPLFITTSLLLLGFLTVCPQSKGDFLFSAYRALTEKLTSKTEPKSDDFCQFEELEMYKIVFDTSAFYQLEKNSDEEDPVLRSEQNGYENSSCETPGMGLYEALNLNLDEKTVEVDWEESAKPAIEEKSPEVFLEPLDDFENMPCYVDEKKSELPSIDTDEFDVKKEVLPKNTGSDEIMGKARGDIVKLGTFSDSSSSRALDSSLGSYGSMRREKEWTRTLACKLFEERHRGNSEEGMDLLWETYENDSSNKGKKTKSNMKIKNKKKIDSEFCYEDDSDENEVVSPQLCCLQALKFSTGKMNLGMGRPNIVKISKAIKGFGWLHHVTRRSKRSYTSNRLVN